MNDTTDSTETAATTSAPLRVLSGNTRIGKVYLRKQGESLWKATAVQTEPQRTAESVNMLDAAYDCINAQLESHNGHKNYETWLVRLWMFDNDERTATRARTVARLGESVSDAADRLLDFAERMAGMNTQPAFVAELIGSVFARVDWHAIAEYARE